jgi:hypothetical protein
MPGDLVGHPSDSLDLEDGLGLGAEGDRRLKGILDAMIAKELEEIGRVLVDDDVCVGNVDAKTVREKFFPILDVEPSQQQSQRQAVGVSYSSKKGV